MTAQIDTNNIRILKQIIKFSIERQVGELIDRRKKELAEEIDDLRKKITIDTVIEVSSRINVFDSNNIYQISFNQDKL